MHFIKISFLILLLGSNHLFGIEKKEDAKPLLGLVMIVKDEAHCMRALIDSVKPYIDRWTILDTGSTDGTQEIIKKELKGVPGKLYEEPFIDFSASRNRVLDLAGESTVFVLTLNGDDTLVNGEKLRDFCQLYQYHNAPAYMVLRTDPSRTCDFYSRRLIRTKARPRFVGRTHEYLGTTSPFKVPEVSIYFDPPPEDFERKKNAWKRDLKILTQDYEKNPSDHRAVFYLAQTYQCLGRLEEAFEWYHLRACMEGFYEEVYESLYRRAQIAEQLKFPFDEVVQLYRKAFEYFPHRAEPLYQIGRLYREKDKFALAYIYCSYACKLPYPKKDGLFVQKNIWNYERWYMMSLTACYVEEYEVGLDAARKALDCYPENDHLREHVNFYLDKIREQA